MIGQLVGQYRVVRKVGEGGMGVVYEAVHTQLHLRAAIKLIHLARADDPRAIARFLVEAQAASAVHHSSLVRLFDYGQLAAGGVYMMMEYLDGQTLRDRLAHGRLKLTQALRLGGQMASALAAVHQAGIVHCDLKPGNAMLVADSELDGGERAKLLDFGIATFVCGPPASPDRARCVGTPRYMSPEQGVAVGSLDDRTDVYSLGVVLFEMLSGEHPHDLAGKDAAAIQQIHLREKPRPLRQLVPEAPIDLALLLREMLATDALMRPRMTQVRDRLKELLVAAALPSVPVPPADHTVTQDHGAGTPASPVPKSAADPHRIIQALGAVLVVDPDFDAFCMDHYPQIYRRFDDTMDRAARQRLLLSLCNLDDLVSQLRRIEPQVLVTLPANSTGGRAGSPAQRTVQPPRAPYDRTWYVSRADEEAQAQDALDYHKPVVFFGPELCGKTWLLSSLLEHARRQEYGIASINLNLIDKSARSSLALFLRMFALRLCKELHLVEGEVERAFANPRSGPIEALNDFMCWTVLPAGPLVLAIDNVDLIAEKPYQDEYFGLLRAWADSGGLFDRLHLALCISTAPALLVHDVHRSPFNLGDVIAVPDFGSEQLATLAQLHGVPCTAEELLLLQAQVGGQPYLSRLALYESHRRRTPLGKLLERVASDPRGGLFAGYLDHLRGRLQQQPELLSAFRGLCENPTASLEPLLGRRLEQAGLITLSEPVESAGAALYRVRYRLYRRLVH